MQQSREQTFLSESVKKIRTRFTHTIQVAMILGSGLGDFAETLPNPLRIPYAEIPAFPPVTVEGHTGELLLSEVSPGFSVACMRGRFHCYEGHMPRDAVIPIRFFQKLGVETLVITNAAGAIRPDLSAGDIMLITDHINFTGLNPLTGPNDEQMGPRFPDMSNAYDVILQSLALQAAHRSGIDLKTGVYIGVNGPNYETPAEIRMMRSFGADAVGMSTVLEVIAARHAGMKVLGLSCITNTASDSPTQTLTHTDVLENAERTKPRFIGLLQEILTLMANPHPVTLPHPDPLSRGEGGYHSVTEGVTGC